MFESSAKEKSKFTHSSNDVSFTFTVLGGALNPTHSLTLFSRQKAPDDWWLIIYSVLLVFTIGRDLSRYANAVSAGNRKFILPPLI